MNYKLDVKKIVFLLLIVSVTQTLSAEWVEPSEEIRYQIIEDTPEERDFLFTAGIQMKNGLIGSFGGNTLYNFDCYIFDPVILTVEHDLFYAGIDFVSSFSHNQPVNTLTNSMVNSVMKAGVEFSLSEKTSSWRTRVVFASVTSGDYRLNYYFEAPAVSYDKFLIRGGYVHQIGTYWSKELTYPVGSESADGRFAAEGTMHGIYLGLGWSSRHYLDMEYEAYGNRGSHKSDTYFKHALDIHWFPLMDIDTGDMSDVYEPDSPFGMEYSLHVFLSDFFGFNLGLGLNPTIKPMGEYAIKSDRFSFSLGEPLDSLYITMGVRFALVN